MQNNEIYQKLDTILKRKNSCSNDLNSKTRLNAIINYCLNRLKSEYSTILINSYFKCDYVFWWADYYSKTDYYRKRIKAISSFVHLFEIIDENPDFFTAYRNYL